MCWFFRWTLKCQEKTETCLRIVNCYRSRKIFKRLKIKNEKEKENATSLNRQTEKSTNIEWKALVQRIHFTTIGIRVLRIKKNQQQQEQIVGPISIQKNHKLLPTLSYKVNQCANCYFIFPGISTNFFYKNWFLWVMHFVLFGLMTFAHYQVRLN